MPWIPNFGLSLWQKGAGPKEYAASRGDHDIRRFVVHYALEDPATRRIGDSQVTLEANTQRNVEGTDQIKIPVRFERNEEGRLGAISFLPQVPSPNLAIATTYPLVMSTVSFWSSIMGIPIGIYGMTVLDEKHNAKYEARPQHAASERFWLPMGLQLGEHWHVILGLYREGKASPSPYFQFLMFFKVLEGFYERKTILIGSLKENLDRRGVEYREPPTRITKDMLLFALAPPEWASAWEGKSFGELYKYLDRTHRRRISHTFPKTEPSLNPDDWNDYHATVFLANLLDQVARDLIVSHLEQMVVKEKEA
ncbi:MAG TPA: methylamine utilization protein MauJ [Candidatus Polarisedimenticolia bacterium]|jgi:hypothetical protein|nr:methylamine utilization protein MauJ [Nitrospirales bacterium]HEV8701823.1 methylamine utilization protein MauJ [Candidatus Polarisedimenticolia bacterium]